MAISEKDKEISHLWDQIDEFRPYADMPGDAMWLRQDDVADLLSWLEPPPREAAPSVTEAPGVPPEIVAQLAEARRAGRETVTAFAEPPPPRPGFPGRPVDPAVLQAAIAQNMANREVLPMSPTPPTPVYTMPPAPPPAPPVPAQQAVDVQALGQALAQLLANQNRNGYAPPMSPIERAAGRFGRW